MKNLTKVAIVTPTVASKHLGQCIQSVSEQTYTNLVHYLVVDGKPAVEEVTSITSLHSNIQMITLDENVGSDGWYGHRVYAACSFLVNADIIVYLDEDNWIDSTHVESLVHTINQGNQWAYSLRKIIDKQGKYICNDDCESLGKWPVFNHSTALHIDTSCFAVTKDIAVKIGHSWYAQWGADRIFFATLRANFTSFACTGKYTLNYRLGSNPNSVTAEFFKRGNAAQHIKYPGGLPWST